MRRSLDLIVPLKVLLSMGLAATLGYLGTGCGGGLTSDAPGASAADLQFCVDETNKYRVAGGRAPITRSESLEDFAATGAYEDSVSMRAHGHFTDTSGGGVALAENTCPSFGGWTISGGGGTLRSTVALCLKAFHDEGPGGGHFEIMMGPYASLGCGWYVDGDKITITQNYGN